MVRPIKVAPGEWDETEGLLEKARELDTRLQKASEVDDSEMRDVRGVEEVRPAHYWTNQQLPEQKFSGRNPKQNPCGSCRLIHIKTVAR